MPLVAEPRLDKQCQGPRQDQLVITQCNADSTLCEVSEIKTVLDTQQVDVACIQETKLLPKDKTREIPQFWAVHHDHPIEGEARGGGLILYVHTALAFSAIYPAIGTSNVLVKLALVIALPGQRKILVNNW